MSKGTTGLYCKFAVTRTDGTDKPGQKHDGCEYFVLDITHDPHALQALRAYADSCRTEYPILAADLDLKTIDIQPSDVTQRLKDQARSVSAMLRDAGCNAMPIPEGVRWLIHRADAAESSLRTLQQQIGQIVSGFRSEAMNGVICLPPIGPSWFPQWDAPPSRNWCPGCRQRWADLFALAPRP